MLTEISLFLCVALMNAKIGFEYEMELQVDSGRHADLGKLLRQRSLYTGTKGLFELQLDDDGEKFDLEALVPPTRLYEGFELNKPESTICPALLDFKSAIGSFEEIDTVSPQKLINIPISSSVLSKQTKHISFTSRSLGSYLLGHLQTTIEIPLERIIDFITLLISEHAFLFTNGALFKDFFAQPHIKDFSVQARFLFFMVTQYYLFGNINEKTPYVRQIAAISSKTNLASIFATFTEKDIKLLGGPENCAASFNEIILVSTRMLYPKEELSTYLVKNGIGEGERIDEKIQGPTLLEYCQQLANGVDLLEKIDPDNSMSYIEYQKPYDIVLELRSILDYADLTPGNLKHDEILWLVETQISDIYHFFSSFNIGEPVEYAFNMAMDICSALNFDFQEKPKISFSVESNVKFLEGYENDIFGPPIDHFPFATGPYGLWDLYWSQKLLSFYFAPPRLYPDGISGTLQQYDEASNSIINFFSSIKAKLQEASSPQENGFEIEVPGVLPRQSVSMNVLLDNIVLPGVKSLFFSMTFTVTVSPSEIFPILRAFMKVSLLESRFPDVFDFVTKLKSALWSNEIKAILFMTTLNQMNIPNFLVPEPPTKLYLAVSVEDGSCLQNLLFGEINAQNMFFRNLIRMEDSSIAERVHRFLEMKKVVSDSVTFSFKSQFMRGWQFVDVLSLVRLILFPQEIPYVSRETDSKKRKRKIFDGSPPVLESNSARI